MNEWEEFKEECFYLITDLLSGDEYCKVTGKKCDYRDCPAAAPKPPRIRVSWTGETCMFVTGEDGKTHGIYLGRAW